MTRHHPHKTSLIDEPINFILQIDQLNLHFKMGHKHRNVYESQMYDEFVNLRSDMYVQLRIQLSVCSKLNIQDYIHTS